MRKEGKMPPDLLERVNEIFQREIPPVFFELAKRIDERAAASEFWPWLLAYKMEEDSARVVLALPDEEWTPEVGEFKCSQAFADRLGMSKQYVDEQLENRFYSGEIMWTQKGAVITPSCGTWIDLQNSRRWYDKLGEAYYKALSFFVENDVAQIDQRIAAKMEKEGRMGQARIIPRYDSVKDYPGLLPAENMKEIFRSRELVCQNQCACRIRYPELGLDPYVCMCFNDTARIAAKMEIGRLIPWEEGFEYVQRQGKIQPHCHINKHAERLDQIGDVLCSCTPDACVLLKSTVQLGTAFKPWKYYGKSRFRAVVDPQKCIGCEKCRTERCLFGAIDMRYNKAAGKERPFVVTETCMGCGCCAETCPAKALTMVCVEPPEYLKGYTLPQDNLATEEENVRPGQELAKL